MGTVNGDMQCLDIDIIDDADYELDHTFNVDIIAIEPTVVMNRAGMARVEIMDNDSKLSLNADRVLYNKIISASISLSTVPTISLTSNMYTGTEGDSSFSDVCVQATLSPGGEFETPLTVTLMGTAGSASESLTIDMQILGLCLHNSFYGDDRCMS